MKLFHLLPLAYLFLIVPAYAQIDTVEVRKFIDNYSKENNNTAILLLMDRGNEEFIYATGLADKEKKIKAQVNDLFEIGSATKMFTAIGILQLIEKGQLSLKTPISRFYPKGKIRDLANYKGTNYFNEVTIEMLLNHTSGFIDYLNVYEDDEKALKILAVEGVTYSFDDIVSLALHHGDANFKPGTQFKYCNTGYVILGDILSKVSGMDWHDYVQKNIFNKAGMKHTYFGSRLPEKAKEKEMTGYYKNKVSYMPPSLAGSAGEIVSNLYDLKKFLIAWQSGKLFLKKSTLEMQRTRGYHPMIEGSDLINYGYGVIKIKGFYGHGGQTFGFQAFATYNPENKRLYVIATNNAVVDTIPLFFSFERIFPE